MTNAQINAKLEKIEELKNKLKELRDEQFRLRREYNKTGNDELVDQERALEIQIDDVREQLITQMEK